MSKINNMSTGGAAEMVGHHLKQFTELLNVILQLSDEDWRSLIQMTSRSVTRVEFVAMCRMVMEKVWNREMKNLLLNLIEAAHMESLLLREEALKHKADHGWRRAGTSSESSALRSAEHPSDFIRTAAEVLFSKVNAAVQEELHRVASGQRTLGNLSNELMTMEKPQPAGSEKDVKGCKRNNLVDIESADRSSISLSSEASGLQKWLLKRFQRKKKKSEVSSQRSLLSAAGRIGRGMKKKTFGFFHELRRRSVSRRSEDTDLQVAGCSKEMLEKDVDLLLHEKEKVLSELQTMSSEQQEPEMTLEEEKISSSGQAPDGPERPFKDEFLQVIQVVKEMVIGKSASSTHCETGSSPSSHLEAFEDGQQAVTQIVGATTEQDMEEQKQPECSTFLQSAPPRKKKRNRVSLKQKNKPPKFRKVNKMEPAPPNLSIPSSSSHPSSWITIKRLYILPESGASRNQKKPPQMFGRHLSRFSNFLTSFFQPPSSPN